MLTSRRTLRHLNNANTALNTSTSVQIIWRMGFGHHDSFAVTGNGVYGGNWQGLNGFA